MSWKKHFVSYHERLNPQSPIPGGRSARDAKSAKFQSWLPAIYSGPLDRMSRYGVFEQMDKDSEVNTALDTISEFSTINNEELGGPFEIAWADEPTDSETQVITGLLQKWNKINEWDRRIFKTFRNTIKFGDQPFIRDPDTWKLFWVDPVNVSRIVVDEAHGKKPAQYVIKNIDPNFEKLVLTAPTGYDTIHATGITGPNTHRSLISNRAPNPQGTTSGGYQTETEHLIDAEHVIHLALTDGMDLSWPFGVSILEPIFKTFKQKELLEDSIIIYRVQRAPERRVFKIDCGDMSPERANAHVERIKNEIHQKRIPTRSGGGSNMLDAQYNPLCLALDTEIPLLDGRTISLQQLIDEFQAGKENWTYSCDPTNGKIYPGNITWAGVTRKNTQAIKLYLDNGKTVTVTPDHKIPVLGKGYVEAQKLTENDSLISFETRHESMKSNKNGAEYHQIYDHDAQEWIYTHRMVAKFFRDRNEHESFTHLEENVNDVLLSNIRSWQENMPNQEKVYTFDQLQAVYDLAKSNDFKLKFMLKDTNNHSQLINLIQRDNPRQEGKNYRIQNKKITQEVIYRTIEHFGYKNWMDFKRKKEQFNHRIVKIEWMDEKIDTGTITIDGQDMLHGHHTFPVNDSIFVKNSIIEDYFFPTTADGRGSDVDTLAGGDNIGDIDDLKYFNNKMARGLRVPSSYLPTGPDDGTASFNDGRVGTAYIQEYRFTMFCTRLQRMFQPTLDEEFKLFVKHNGHQIDSGKFELAFVEPQNFASFREIEIDGARVGLFNQIEGTPYMAKRFSIRKYLGLTEEEIKENEQLWIEENQDQADESDKIENMADLGDVGVTGGIDGSIDDFAFDEDDIAAEGEIEQFGAGEDLGGESPVSGAEGGEQIQ